MKLDVKGWLAKVTGQTEFKTLLWTASSDSTQAPTTFPVNDYYDAIDVYFRGNGRPMVPMRVERSMGSRTCNITWANYFAYRVIGFDGSQVTIGVGGYYNAYNSGSAVNGDSYAIPYKIYGVKYVGGVLRSISKAFSHFHKGGGVNESRFERTCRFHAKENKRSNVSKFGDANILCTVNLDDTGRSNRLRPSDIFLSDLGNDKYIGLQKYAGFRSSRASNYHIFKLAYKCRWSRIKFYNASRSNNYRALTHSGRGCVA